MDTEAWQMTVHGAAIVRHDFTTKTTAAVYKIDDQQEPITQPRKLYSVF